MDATDISQEMLAVTQKNAKSNGCSELVHCKKMSAEKLDYPDNTFAGVVGSGVLHHVNLELTAKEIHRVLVPGGRGIFIEPLGHNPLLNLYRKLTPAQHTSFERPLKFSSFRNLKDQFPEFRHREFHLLTFWPLLWYALSKNERRFQRGMVRWSHADDWICRTFSALRRFYWITVLEFTKANHNPADSLVSDEREDK